MTELTVDPVARARDRAEPSYDGDPMRVVFPLRLGAELLQPHEGTITREEYHRRLASTWLEQLFELDPLLVDRVAIAPSGCWIWTGRLVQGYGEVRRRPQHWRAHRYVYTLLIGPIPDGLTLDHRCHSDDLACAGGVTCPHRACVFPFHMDPVSLGVNVLRGRGVSAQASAATHCPNGHPYDEANTYFAPATGQRLCRRCRRIRNRDASRRRTVERSIA